MLDKGLFYTVVNKKDGAVAFQAMYEYQCKPHKQRGHEIIKTADLLQYLDKLASC